MERARKYKGEKEGNVNKERESLECHKDKCIEKYKHNDDTESSCKNAAKVRGKGECPTSRESNLVNDADWGTLVSEENDQSDLVMLGQEDKKLSTRDTHPAAKECSQQTLETDACRSVVNSLTSPKEEFLDELLNESLDVPKVAQHSDLTQGEDERKIHEDNADLPRTDENINKEPAKEELDSEQENVPLREILLKLKVSISCYISVFDFIITLSQKCVLFI